jgi:hypothetical protein
MNINKVRVQIVALHIFGLESVWTFSDALFGFMDLIRHAVGLLWTSDQPAAKASTVTGQHNIHASSRIRTHNPRNQAAMTYALDLAATGTGVVAPHPAQISLATCYFLSFTSRHSPQKPVLKWALNL